MLMNSSPATCRFPVPAATSRATVLKLGPADDLRSGAWMTGHLGVDAGHGIVIDTSWSRTSRLTVVDSRASTGR
jgi:hypothetical protein